MGARLAYRIVARRLFAPISNRVALRILDDILLDEGRALFFGPEMNWREVTALIEAGEFGERDFVAWVARRAHRMV